MALINCPECGKENVSDTAESCPSCGFNIKKSIDEKKSEELRLQQEQKKEQERIKLEEERKAVRSKYINLFWGSTIKKVIVSCLLLMLSVLIIFCIVKQIEIKNDIDSAYKTINWIAGDIEEVNDFLSDDDIIYGSPERHAIKKLWHKLKQAEIDMQMLNKYYKKNQRVSSAIDNRIASTTMFQNWVNYKEYLYSNYFIKDTIDDSADAIFESKTKYYKGWYNIKEYDSVFVENKELSSLGSYYRLSGTVKNNTSSTVYSVEVKVILLDENNKVIYTENTYACGDEGLDPGESAEFECDNIIKFSELKRFTARIYDYKLE